MKETSEELVESYKKICRESINLTTRILYEWKVSFVMDLFLMAAWFGIGLLIGLKLK